MIVELLYYSIVFILVKNHYYYCVPVSVFLVTEVALFL